LFVDESHTSRVFREKDEDDSMKAEHSNTAETKCDTNIPNLPPVTPPLSKRDDDYNLEGCNKAQRGMTKELFLSIWKECIIILELTLDGILAFAVCLIWA